MTNRQTPSPDEAFPNPKIPSLCFIKNVVTNPRIIIGDYTYYDDVDGADQFEKHVTHFYDFIGDRLIIGKFCAIAKGVEFVRMRFDDEFIAYLLELKWWNWDIEKIEANFKALSSGDLSLIRKISK